MGEIEQSAIIGIITGEFFWGVVAGVVISILGAFVGTRFGIKANNREFRRRQADLGIELVENVGKVVDELDEHLRRTGLIVNELLDLLDVEIGVYGRNREHLILLPRETRRQLQKFMTDIAVQRGEVISCLTRFGENMRKERDLAADGEGEMAQRANNVAGEELAAAKQGVTRLTTTARRAQQVIDQLRKSA